MALTLFIAEDEPLARASLAELLSAQGGVEILGTADSEMAATEWLLGRSKTCDLLITDLLLVPGGSGFGIIRHAKRLGVFRHIVVFSNFVTSGVAERCKALGADAVFLKSDLEGLLAFVRTLADAAAAEGAGE